MMRQLIDIWGELSDMMDTPDLGVNMRSLYSHCEKEGWSPHRSGLEHFQPEAQGTESSAKCYNDILSLGVGGLQEFSQRSLKISS